MTWPNHASRCSHPHCRTSLDEHPVTCPHGLPFCEGCTWEEGCAECDTETQAPVLDLQAALNESMNRVAAIPDAPDTRAAAHVPSAPSWRPAPDLTRGDLVLAPAERPRACGRCGRPITVGAPSVAHWAVKGSAVADYYHPACAELGATA